MNARQAVFGAAGLLAVVLAVAAAGTLPVSPLVAALGNDYLLVAALGGLGLVVAAAAVGHGRRPRTASVPDPERSVAVPPAGVAFDDAVAGWWTLVPFSGRERRSAVRERLRAAAVGAVLRTEQCSRAEAARRVDAGEWTDDDRAAAFLAADASPSLLGVPGALARRESWFGHCARRTAAAVAARDGTVEGGDGGE